MEGLAGQLKSSIESSVIAETVKQLLLTIGIGTQSQVTSCDLQWTN
jgi:hypothetical protein